MRRQSRLLDAAAYGRVFRKAQRSRDKLFTVLYRENGRRAPRLGLAISKKHSRRAVARNRIKRIVRESFRHQQSELPAVDIVVISQPATEKASNKAMFESLAGHWARCASNAQRGRR